MDKSIDQVVEETMRDVEALKSGEPEEILDTEEEIITEEPEYSAIELEAMKKGWNPDKEAVPEGKEWIDAGEFMRNEKFFSEIRKLKRENNLTKRALDDLKEHHRKVQEIERKKLIDQLKRQKKVALEEDDHDTVIEIDEQMSEIKAQEQESKAIEQSVNTDAQVAYQEAFTDWVNHNSWYNSNQQMRTVADAMGRELYAERQGNIEPDELFAYVEEQVKGIFPQEFKPKKTAAPSAPAVEGARAGGARARTQQKQKYTTKDLNETQRQVMNRFVRTGALTEQEYIDELVKTGEIG